MEIKTATFDFLARLKENNNREWFQEHKAEYDAAHQNVIAFVDAAIAELAQVDPHINTDIKASKCLFRIYRDVRFSKNKSPYKNWLAAGISVDGRKLDGPEYYLHIEPNRNIIAVGYWMPKKEHLDAIRQEIDYNYKAFEEALQQGGWTVKDLSQEDKLKRPPAGYAADDLHIEVLKLKSFILQKELSNAEMSSPDAIQHVMAICKRVLSFKKFIHQAIDI